MKGLRISIVAGLLAATVAVWITGYSNHLLGPAAKTRADAQPQLQPEVVVIAPGPELPVMDTVNVTATRESGSATATRDEPGRTTETVSGSGVAPAGRKPIAGYAPGPQPGMTNQGFPYRSQRFEQ